MHTHTIRDQNRQSMFTVPILQRSKKYFVYLPFQYWEISSSFINMLLVLHSMLLLDFFRSKTIGINHYSYMSGHGPMFQMVALLNLSNLCCKTNLYETPPDFINNFISYYWMYMYFFVFFHRFQQRPFLCFPCFVNRYCMTRYSRNK